MKLIDIIILIAVLLVVALICYFYFWKNRNKPCHGCPYCNSCEKVKSNSDKCECYNSKKVQNDTKNNEKDDNNDKK